MVGQCPLKGCRIASHLPLPELALVLVRLDHVARIIVNANHFIARAHEKLTAFVELESAISFAPFTTEMSG